MAHQVIALNCPNCGAAVDAGQKTCLFCKQPVVITTFNSVYSMPMSLVNKYAGTYKNALLSDPENKELNISIAMCYLKLKLYDKALGAFEKAVEDNFDNSETFFYAAVCLLKGQKAFNTPVDDIKKALDYIKAAILIEPRGVYYLFSAYIKYDFYERKYLNITPNYLDELREAKNNNLTSADAQMLFDTLGKPIPEQLNL
jgi:tetratricopeptide (TPR) repeat protein